MTTLPINKLSKNVLGFCKDFFELNDQINLSKVSMRTKKILDNDKTFQITKFVLIEQKTKVLSLTNLLSKLIHNFSYN